MVDRIRNFVNSLFVLPVQETERERLYREYYEDPEIKAAIARGERV